MMSDKEIQNIVLRAEDEYERLKDRVHELYDENEKLKDGINKVIEFINNLPSGTKENFIIYGGYEVKEYLKELIKNEKTS